MAIIRGKLAWAAYRASEGLILSDSIRDSRREVVDYLFDSFGKKYAETDKVKPQRVMIVPVDFGQT